MISDVQFSKILRKQNVSIVHPLNWVKEPTNEMNSSHAHINLPPQKKRNQVFLYSLMFRRIPSLRPGRALETMRPKEGFLLQTPRSKTRRVRLRGGSTSWCSWALLLAYLLNCCERGIFKKKVTPKFKLKEKNYEMKVSIFANTSICQSSLCVHHVLAELNVWKGTITTRETRRCNCQPSLPKIKTSVEHVHTLASRK